jgi:uncharacterized phage-associated protein
MKQRNNEKIKATILYILNAIPDGVDLLKLFKIIYFASRDHLARYGRPIIDDDFVAMKHGPVLTDTFNKLRGGRFSFVEKDPEVGYMIFAREKPDVDELSASDVECLDLSIHDNKNLRFGKLSEKSHDAAWQLAWNSRGNKESAPMDLIEIARAGGADENTLDYIKENLFIDACLC